MSTVRVLLWVVAVLAFGLATQLPLRITAGAWQAHVPKVGAQSLASYLVVIGSATAVGAVLLHLYGAGRLLPIAALLGISAALLAADYVQRATTPTGALEATFGTGWQDQLPEDATSRMLQRRWQWRLPGGPAPRWDRDVAYATVPEVDRELLADLWQPPEGVEPSGLGLVYVHGGYYELLDKDSGTRPLFRHLTRQGHVVMDISYRLLDETDIVGMVHDVKRATAWLAAHADRYRLDADRIVVAGASSGGNLALLAAYSHAHPELTPDDIGTEPKAHGVVAYYGVHDWPAFAQLDDAEGRRLRERLLGGSLDEMADRYALASPVSHVDADTPATLLVQGLHDVQHLIDANRQLAEELTQAGVPVANVELARTDHAFDLILPQVAPAGMAALHDLERFLAVLAPHDERATRD